MAKNTTFAEGRGIAHKGSPGTSMAFPDVCNTPIPTPAGPIEIPLPYLNIAKSADVIDGPTTVTCDGQMPMCKDSKCSKSSGDEPGSKGGIFSRVNKGVGEPISYSFEVKFEGRGVVRLGDKLSHNKKNI